METWTCRQVQQLSSGVCLGIIIAMAVIHGGRSMSQIWHGQCLTAPYSLSSHENPMSISYTISKGTLVCQGAKPVLLISIASLVSKNTAGSLSDGDLTLRDKICRRSWLSLTIGHRVLGDPEEDIQAAAQQVWMFLFKSLETWASYSSLQCFTHEVNPILLSHPLCEAAVRVSYGSQLKWLTPIQ